MAPPHSLPPHARLRLNKPTHATLHMLAESRQSWGSVFVIARHVYSSASLSPTASTTAAHAARPACCRLVYNVNEGRGQ